MSVLTLVYLWTKVYGRLPITIRSLYFIRVFTYPHRLLVKSNPLVSCVKNSTLDLLFFVARLTVLRRSVHVLVSLFVKVGSFVVHVSRVPPLLEPKNFMPSSQLYGLRTTHPPFNPPLLKSPYPSPEERIPTQLVYEGLTTLRYPVKCEP